jgi:diguanylate cyclase (GGDEF)-like protein
MVSPGSLWFIACPLIAILLGSVRSALVWLAVTTAALAGLQLALGNNVAFLTPATDNPHVVYLVNLIGLSLAIAAFLALVEHARRQGFRRLEAANRTISDLAMRDALTGVYNRRYIIDEISRAGTVAAGASFCICLLDLDRFKSINDNFGHAAGDHVLQAVAACIQGELRQQDCFGRYGGEEFLLLLKNTDLAGGRHFLERIRQHVESLPMADLPELACVTISAGIAAYRCGEPFAQTIARADRALYAAKNAGRNRVMLESAV